MIEASKIKVDLSKCTENPETCGVRAVLVDEQATFELLGTIDAGAESIAQKLGACAQLCGTENCIGRDPFMRSTFSDIITDTSGH